MIPRNLSAIAKDLEALTDRVQRLLYEIEQLDMQEILSDTSTEEKRNAVERRIKTEIEETEEAIGHTLATLATRLLLYTEALQLPAARALVTAWQNRWSGEQLGATKHWWDSETEGRESPAFTAIEPIISGLLVLLKQKQGLPPIPSDRHDRDRLEYCLRSLAKLCRERNVIPASEYDVQKVMHSHLAGVFRDYTTTATIAKPLLSFRPDGGVISLKAAIECKFVASDKEISAALHGLTEDLSGYAGSSDWTHFYSLVYMTNAYATEGQFASALGQSGNAGTWTTIIVTGPGARIAKGKRTRQIGRGTSRGKR